MFRLTSLPPLLLLAASLAFAQGIGGTLTSRASSASLTIFDEIQDSRERTAFRGVWDAQDPQKQRDLATRFVEQYPRSILLREAYELGARAYIALGDDTSGLEWAKRSLRLMPENPFLLVMMADVAARQKQLDLAETSARDALSYLAKAATPVPLKPEEWPRVRNDLRASSYFVLGRVAGMRDNFKEAELFLTEALKLRPDDAQTLYVLGLTRMELKNGTPPPVSSPGAVVVPAGGRSAGGEYAGSSACRECHTREYESWRSTGMSKMFRPYRAEDVVGDFSGRQTVSDNARAITADGRHFFDIKEGETNRWVRYPVDYIIGSKWQQAYATRLPDARLLVFPIQYSRLQSTWLNYWKIVDGPESLRADISRFHQIPEEAVYQNTCAPCHTSQLKVQESSAGAAPMTFLEGGINCEMCHGPSLAHVKTMKGGAVGSASSTRRPADPPIRFGQISAAESVSICAQCHAQSAVHQAQAGGAVNYSDEGAPFYRTYAAHLPSNFARSAFYRDGRYRATTFISEAFARSQCFRKGGATCVSCHDPHPPDANDNPTSLKFRQNANQMCVQCHTNLRDRNPQRGGSRVADADRHTRHAAGTEASLCVSCHMPRIVDALLFPARSHEIDDIPDAEMTARFGATDSPNACLGCHRDRDTGWLQRELRAFRAF